MAKIPPTFDELKKTLLTEDEQQRLVVALGLGQREFSDEDVDQVLAWGRKARFAAEMLDLALRGLIILSIKKNGIAFAHPLSSWATPEQQQNAYAKLQQGK